ncbi:MAG: MBOAT family O-acyltransferase [Chloroflexota bacterium]
MSLAYILILIGAALLIGLFRRARGWWMLAASVLALYWLQPPTTIRYLDFWLPTATLGLSVLGWAVTAPAETQKQPRTFAFDRNLLRDENLLAAAGVIALVLSIAGLRYIDALCCLTPNRPPVFGQVAVVLAVLSLGAFALWRSRRPEAWLTAVTVLLLVLFAVLKSEPLGAWAAAGLRTLGGQDRALAAAAELRWLGFSFVAFRLIHTLRDRAAGRLPALTLREYVTFAIFFPALPAGPLDRAQRFARDLHTPFTLGPDTVLSGGKRIVWGLFKKFALADTLALIALSAANAGQVQAAAWAWVLLYAYALRIYLDFSGYTDVAIGTAQLMGVALPENFERPYLKSNLTAFWNSWHISLAQWFRAYWFNPLTRTLRGSTRPISLAAIIFSAQVTTMLLIGLWHGITWNFAIWGLWHGLGLFVHNRWSELLKGRTAAIDERPRLQRALAAVGTLLTFHYVTLGWVWFALPETGMALDMFAKLLMGK